MRHSTLRSLLLLSAAPMLAPAQDLLGGADQDVLNALVFNGRAESKQTATRELPADLERVAVPDGFVLIGTATRPDGTSNTAFRTTHSTEEAIDRVLAALMRDGWEVEMPQQMQRPTFSTPASIQYRVLCKDSNRRAVAVRDADAVRYVAMSALSEPAPRACHAPQPAQGGMPDFQAIQRLMPQLDFPASARVQGGGPSAGGSSNSYSAGTRVHSPEEPAVSLALHLSRQLTAQGWTRDAAWTGELGAGSSWTRQSERGALVGILEISDMGQALYDVQFRLLMPGS